MERRREWLVHAPQLLSTWNLEFSLHKCPKLLLKELVRIFPDKEISEDLIIIPTFQESKLDMVVPGMEMQELKDALLERFFDFATKVVKRLQEKDHWADFFDPSSGLPVLKVFPIPVSASSPQFYSSRGGMTFSEDFQCQLLGYSMVQLGSCWVLEHPRWKTSTYPATLVSTAPPSEIIAAIQQIGDPPPNPYLEEKE